MIRHSVAIWQLIQWIGRRLFGRRTRNWTAPQTYAIGGVVVSAAVWNSIVEECPFPHCDSNVLHAPGECQYCDRYPVLQVNRAADRVNFTGKREVGKAQCPSEEWRDLETIELWPGNLPSRDPRYAEIQEARRAAIKELEEKYGIIS